MDRFSIGKVFETGFKIWFRNLVPFTVIAVLIFSPVIIWSAVLFLDPTTHWETLKWWPLYYVACALVLNVLTSAAVTYGVVMQLQGNRAGIAACIGKGFSRLLPVLAVGILQVIFMALGFVALIIPGFMVMCALYVATPSAVIERPGVWGAIKRSAELTRGHRWEILGVVFLVGAIGRGVGYAEESFKPTTIGELTGYLFVNLAIQLLLSTLSAVISSVSYYYLRHEKDGTSVDELAAVFA